MALGRPARPAPLRLLEGRTPGHDSGGRPVPKAPPFERVLPVKPDHLSGVAGELWDRVCEQLPRVGLLKEIDGPALEMACETYARWRTALEIRQKMGLLMKLPNGTLRQGPWVKAELEASSQFRMWCCEYGLTPAAEQRVSQPVKDDDEHANPYAESG